MSDDLIKRSDAIKAYNEAMDELVKWQMEEWQLGDFSECEFNTTDCKHIVRKLEAIPSADRPQEWIPCSERLPKIGEYHISEPCLVYCKGGVYAFAELEENIFGQVGWNCERDDDYHEPIGEVVAWMPLPKPWEGADNE